MITSVAGSPLVPATWSGAPANLAAALSNRSVEIVPLDSSLLSRAAKALHCPAAMMQGLPWRATSWSRGIRYRRGQFVAEQARAAGVDHILCTGSLDVPLGSLIPYSIWMDNTWHLLCSGGLAPNWATGKAFRYIDRLERAALGGAKSILTFGSHVRENVVNHYGLPASRVFAVGCGCADLPPFEGNKDFANGHLLFVAKHAFCEKGGELALKAFEIIRKSRPQTRLVVVGSQDTVARLAGIPGVEAHGFISREKLNGLFYDAAILLQPMLGDSWGQVYLEAMKARALVVSLNIEALPEIMNGNRYGLLVDKPEPQLLADAVLKVYRMPQVDLDAIAYEAQLRVTHMFNWDAVASRVLRGLISEPD